MRKQKGHRSVPDETTTQEGDRLPGEDAPQDDSHIQAQIEPVGDPDQPPADPQPEPEPTDDGLVEATIGGQTLRVTQEVAVAIAQEQALLAPPPAVPPEPVSEPPADDVTAYDTLLFSNPEAAVARIKSEIFDEVRQEYQLEETRKAFWSDFYAENDDLREHDWIVKAIIQQNWDTFGNMSGKSARDAVADATKKEILNISNKFGKGGRRKGASSTLESPSQPNAPAPSAESVELDEAPMTLSDVLRARKRARMKSSQTTLG
tara:strand:- start:2098 stop:2883 length:786 start_codon:yes stop_codon:yes gene_type:complete